MCIENLDFRFSWFGKFYVTTHSSDFCEKLENWQHGVLIFVEQQSVGKPTPVFLSEESQGWGSLVGCRLWGRTESDMTEATAAAVTWKWLKAAFLDWLLFRMPHSSLLPLTLPSAYLSNLNVRTLDYIKLPGEAGITWRSSSILDTSVQRLLQREGNVLDIKYVPSKWSQLSNNSQFRERESRKQTAQNTIRYTLRPR